MKKNLNENVGTNILKYGGSVLDTWIKHHPGTMMTAGGGLYLANKIDNSLEDLKNTTIDQKVKTSDEINKLSDSISDSLLKAKETIKNVFSQKNTNSVVSENISNPLMNLSIVSGLTYTCFKNRKVK